MSQTENEILERLKKLEEEQARQLKMCPDCGRCATCGRGGQRVYAWPQSPWLQRPIWAFTYDSNTGGGGRFQ